MTFTGDAERRLESLLSALLPIIVVLPETFTIPLDFTPLLEQFFIVTSFKVKVPPPSTRTPASSPAKSDPSIVRDEIVVEPEAMMNGEPTVEVMVMPLLTPTIHTSSFIRFI